MGVDLAWSSQLTIAAAAQHKEGSPAMFKTFRERPDPWNIEGRVDRMRYLLDHLAWKGSIVQPKINGEWAVFNSHDGLRVVALWPTEASAKNSLGDKFDDIQFSFLRPDTVFTDVIDKLYEDEYIAAFPNVAMEYEVLDASEFRNGYEFAALKKKGALGNLSDDDSLAFGKYVGLTKKL